VIEMIDHVTAAIRAVCLLTGSRTPHELARAPRHLGSPLRTFLTDLGLAP